MIYRKHFLFKIVCVTNKNSTMTCLILCIINFRCFFFHFYIKFIIFYLNLSLLVCTKNVIFCFFVCQFFNVLFSLKHLKNFFYLFLSINFFRTFFSFFSRQSNIFLFFSHLKLLLNVAI